MKLAIKILTILFLISVIFVVKAARAEEKNSGPMISVVPHTFDLNVFPGEIVNDKIKIYNQGDIAVPFKLKLISFDAEDNTGDMILKDLDGEEASVKNWIKFDKEEFIIDPKQKETVNFSLKIPADAKNQGYYFTVLLEADISTYYFNESRVQTIPNLAIPFLLRVGEDETGADPLSILEYSIPEEQHLAGAEKVVNFLGAPFLDEGEKVAVIGSGEPEFVVKLKNNSPYHTKLTGKIDISGLGWKVKNEMEFPALTILPGKTRQVLVRGLGEKATTEEKPKEEKSGEVLGFGIVRANLNLESKDGIQKNEKQWIFVFSWQLVGWLILLIAIIFGGVKIFKKNLKRFSQIKDSKWAEKELRNKIEIIKKTEITEGKTEERIKGINMNKINEILEKTEISGKKAEKGKSENKKTNNKKMKQEDVKKEMKINKKKLDEKTKKRKKNSRNNKK